MRQETARPVVAEAEEILDKYFPVHDAGFVALKDYMGSDACIEEAARTSYAYGIRKRGDTRTLIRSLMRRRHTSPFEMCLAGDVRVQTYPCTGAKVKHYTMKELALAFSKDAGKAGAWARLVFVRTLRADGAMGRTRIKHVWCTGVQQTFRVKTKRLNREIVATASHPFLCADGQYRQLGELRVGDLVQLNGRPAIPEEVIRIIQERRLAGIPIEDIAAETGVSKSAVFGFGKLAGVSRVPRKTGFFKKSVGAYKDPWAVARRSSKKGVCALCNDPGSDVHHVDKNPQNNEECNLLRLCAKHHKHVHTLSVLRVPVLDEVVSIEPAGEQEVFDLETEQATHNFVAEGFIVHNCEFKFHMAMPIFVARQIVRHRTASLNEMSGRYSLMPMLFYTPSAEQVQAQSKKDKQGRDGALSDVTVAEFRAALMVGREAIESSYRWSTENDIARELARIDLPLSTYTQWYWKIDGNNLFKALSLRCDMHAQWETRMYFNVIAGMAKRLMPDAFEAWEDYNFYAKTFSRQEMESLRELLRNSDNPYPDSILDANGMTKKEKEEFYDKLRKPEQINFDLDLSSAKEPGFFEELYRKSAEG